MERISKNFVWAEAWASDTAARQEEVWRAKLGIAANEVMRAKAQREVDAWANIAHDDKIRAAITRMARDVLEPLRSEVGAFSPTSWYRCERLEHNICRPHYTFGGNEWKRYFRNKKHPKGLAVDILLPHMPAADLHAVLRVMDLPSVDLCLLEYGRWVHIAIAADGEQPRNQYSEVS